jgi:hypothetical protein
VLSRIARLLTAAALIVTIATASFAGEGDWFSQSGFTIMEAVGSPELGYTLVGTDDKGFQLLGKGDWFKNKFRVDAVGAEQVKVFTEEKGATVAPILHSNLPADVFLVALATVYQRSIVVGAQVDSLKPFSPELLTDPAKLADFCKAEGLDLRVFDDCMLVRKGQFPADLKPFSSTEPQLSVNVSVIRGTLTDLTAAVAKSSGKVITPAGTASGPLSVKSFGLSAQALAYYTQCAVDAGFTVAEPAAVAAAPAAPAKTKAGAKLKQLLAEKKYVPAARLAKALILRDPTKAGYYNAFGLALWNLGKRNAAKQVWERSLKVDPANKYASKALAKIQAFVAARRNLPAPSAAVRAGF